MNRFAMAIALACLLGSQAVAAATPAPAAIVDPLRIKAARDMLTASRVVRNARMGAALAFEAALNGTLQKSPIANDAELIAIVRQTGLNQMSLILDELVPKMVDDMALSYAAHLTTAEMQEATAFYLAPTGQKLLDLTPSMAAEASARMQERVQPYLPQVQDAVQKALLEALAKREKPKVQQ